MESLKELYRIGPGPSSSHTLAIKRICQHYLNRYPNAKDFEVTLYGSLALTGKGHMTDKVIYDSLGENTNLQFSSLEKKHPNTIEIKSNEGSLTYFSIGGGAFTIEGEDFLVDQNVYLENSMHEITMVLDTNKWNIYEYITKREPDIYPFLEKIWHQMKQTIQNGLSKEGLLPGKLKLSRISKQLYDDALKQENPIESRDLLITAYAYACSEENASGGEVVTAPTLGSCGVLPAVLYYYETQKNISEEKIIQALAVGGIYGNLIKTNASISGAEGGCQAEIGTACAMAAAAIGWLEDLSISQISYAAEIGIEHHLGLTCDPVGGYVMIPCIERNGVASLRALDAVLYAKHIGKIRANRVSFDQVVKTMNYTGKKIARELRETSLGGLANVIKDE